MYNINFITKTHSVHVLFIFLNRHIIYDRWSVRSRSRVQSGDGTLRQRWVGRPSRRFVTVLHVSVWGSLLGSGGCVRSFFHFYMPVLLLLLFERDRCDATLVLFVAAPYMATIAMDIEK
jgi:hypothetical protein